MCERLLRQSVCLHSQSPPQKLCMDDESLDSLVLVRTCAAINEGASQPRRPLHVHNICKYWACFNLSSFVQNYTVKPLNWDNLQSTIFLLCIISNKNLSMATKPQVKPLFCDIDKQGNKTSRSMRRPTGYRRRHIFSLYFPF